MSYDLLIKNGMIYDGTGSPGYRGSVGIKGDRIVAVGEVTGEAKETINADGLAVSPGFVDVHTAPNPTQGDHIGSPLLSQEGRTTDKEFTPTCTSA